MGGVVSCITGMFRTIGNCIMAVIAGIGNILKAIINGVVSFCAIIVRFLTCGYCGGKGGGRKRGTTSRV